MPDAEENINEEMTYIDQRAVLRTPNRNEIRNIDTEKSNRFIQVS